MAAACGESAAPKRLWCSRRKWTGSRQWTLGLGTPPASQSAVSSCTSPCSTAHALKCTEARLCPGTCTKCTRAISYAQAAADANSIFPSMARTHDAHMCTTCTTHAQYVHMHGMHAHAQGAPAAAAAPETDPPSASAAVLSMYGVDKGHVESCLSVVVTALAVVMAGTGG